MPPSRTRITPEPGARRGGVGLGLALAGVVTGLIGFSATERGRAPVPTTGALPTALVDPPPQPRPEGVPSEEVRDATLTLGVFGDGGRPHARFVALREPRGAAAPARFFVDTARRAAEAGLSVGRSAQAAPIATKFGMAELAEVSLSAGGATRTCLVVRFAHPEIGFRLFGWRCGPEDQPTDRAHLACLLDRLTLAPAEADASLRVLFAQAERRRDAACEGATASDEGLAAMASGWLALGPVGPGPRRDQTIAERPAPPRGKNGGSREPKSSTVRAGS